MNIFAIDPGSEQSALLLYDAARRQVLDHGILSNPQLMVTCLSWADHVLDPVLVVESFESYGMAVGAEVFRTVWWAGRFHEAWMRGRNPNAYQLSRRAVKLNLCQSARATDANVRQAILDRFAATKAEAIGRKGSPGPLYGVKSHEFAALAVALTWADHHAPAARQSA